MLNFEELSHKLFSLVIFRNLLNDDVIKSFTELADEQKSEKKRFTYMPIFSRSYLRKPIIFQNNHLKKQGAAG